MTLTLSSRLTTVSAIALSVHWASDFLAGRAHQLELLVEILLGAEAGLDLLEALFGERLAGGLVGIGGLGVKQLDLDEAVEHLPLQHRHLLGRDVLVAGGGLAFDADDLLVQLAAVDLDALAFGDDRIAEQARRV